jgi:hypothetical protein
MPTIVTFNSFPGAPIPYLFNGQIGIGLKASPASSSPSRLERQIEALSRLHYDIGCFQEVFSQQAFGDYVRFHRSICMEAVCSGCGPSVTIATLCLVPLLCLVAALHSRNMILFLAVSLIVILCVKNPEFTPLSFTVRCANHSGLITFYNVKRYVQFRPSEILRLPNQGLDFLNLFQPRVALITFLWDATTSDRLVVVNTHLNALGGDLGRQQQLHFIKNHLLEYSDLDFHSTYICGDFNFRHSANTYAEHITWDPANNPLCKGWMRNLPPCQIDFIEAHGHSPRLRITDPAYSTHTMDYTSDHYLLMLQSGETND